MSLLLYTCFLNVFTKNDHEQDQNHYLKIRLTKNRSLKKWTSVISKFRRINLLINLDLKRIRNNRVYDILSQVTWKNCSIIGFHNWLIGFDIRFRNCHKECQQEGDKRDNLTLLS